MPLAAEGKKAPSFKSVNTQGDKVSLADLMGKNGLVLYFYPKDMTPGCTTESCDFRDNLKKLNAAGFQVAGVSRDSIARHQKFTEKYELNFPLIADESGEVCEKYGVWQEKKFMGKTHMGIVRSTFVIGSDGKIKKVYSPVKVKDHIAQILEDIKQL